MSTDGGEPVMRGLLWQLATAPMMIVRALVLGREEAAELAHIHASARRWLDEQPVTAAQPDTDPLALYGKQATDLQAEVKRLRQLLTGADTAIHYMGGENLALREVLEQARADLAQRTRERDAARTAITGVSAPLLERTVALGKANADVQQLTDNLLRQGEQLGEQAEEIEHLRAEVDRLLERGVGDDESGYLIKQRNHWRTVAENQSTHIQELVEQREQHNAEIERLRADVVWLTTAHDALNDDALKWTGIAGRAAEEIEQLRDRVANRTGERDAANREIGRLSALLNAFIDEGHKLREDLAHARTQLPGTPGQMVTLRFEDGRAVTGKLEVHHNQRTVRGLLVDVVGRSLIPAPDGGEHR